MRKEEQPIEEGDDSENQKRPLSQGEAWTLVYMGKISIKDIPRVRVML